MIFIKKDLKDFVDEIVGTDFHYALGRVLQIVEHVTEGDNVPLDELYLLIKELTAMTSSSSIIEKADEFEEKELALKGYDMLYFLFDEGATRYSTEDCKEVGTMVREFNKECMIRADDSALLQSIREYAGKLEERKGLLIFPPSSSVDQRKELTIRCKPIILSFGYQYFDSFLPDGAFDFTNALQETIEVVKGMDAVFFAPNFRADPYCRLVYDFCLHYGVRMFTL